MPVSQTPDDRVYLGVSWYPEMWDESEWAADVDRMAEAGMGLIRMFEFAWKRMEPKEGQYDFAWARKILDLLHAKGIKAQLGTPSAAPPAWLTTAYPEVMAYRPDGTRRTHGMRKHYSLHSPVYRQHCKNIVRKMVEELGDHPAVHSWQIDNEMGSGDSHPDCIPMFHKWLEDRYGDIETLNKTWGLQFWSQAYDSFDQIPAARAEFGTRGVPERHHPSLLVAWARFHREGRHSFIQDQVDVIREACSHPIATNMTGGLQGSDWSHLFSGLDRAGASMYADLNYYYLNWLRFDRLRSEKTEPYWLMETAPNWSGGGPVWNIHHDERGIRMFSWISVLMGGSMVLYWQWRSHWAGQEMQHGTCVSQTGAFMPGLSAWQRLGREFTEHSEFLLANKAQRGPIGIVHSAESVWNYSIDPIDPQKNKYEERIRFDIQLPLLNRHYQRDIVHVRADYSPYKLLIFNRLPIFDEADKTRLKEWVANGGTAIIGPMTGIRTTEVTTWTDRVFGGLEELMGSESSIKFSPHWVEDTIDVVFEDGSSSHPCVWCDGFADDKDATVLARYKGGYGDGHAAVIDHRYGKGRVITVGTTLDEDTYLKLITDAAADLDINPIATVDDASEGVVTCPRTDSDGKLVAIGVVNTKKEARSITLVQGGHDLLEDEAVGKTVELAPLQVRLITLS